jgi:predicted helicase
MRTTEIGGINKKSAMLRQLVVDQANQKISTVIKILKNIETNGGIKYTLLYSPKGDYGDENEDDDYKLIEKIARQVSMNFDNLVHHIFLGETEDRDLLLDEFEKGDVHLLHAIKCLDEGVDVPKTRNAIFVASGKNKREYIQRRGRVLRKDGDKIAQLYDIVVIPTLDQFNSKSNISTSFLKNEFKRVYEFLELSRVSTKTKVIKDINNTLINFGYNYYSLVEELNN